MRFEGVQISKLDNNIVGEKVSLRKEIDFQGVYFRHETKRVVEDFE
jgi:hypothetical protein